MIFNLPLLQIYSKHFFNRLGACVYRAFITALQQSGLSGRHFGWAAQINQNSSGLPEIALLHQHTGPKDTKEQEPYGDGGGSAHFCCRDFSNSFGPACARFTVLWVTRCSTSPKLTKSDKILPGKSLFLSIFLPQSASYSLLPMPLTDFLLAFI